MKINSIHCLVFAIALCAVNSKPVFGQASEYQIKAAFIERFTRFIEWEEDSIPEKDFHITVLGESPFGNQLENIFESLKTQGRTTNIHYTTDIQKIGNSQIVFVCEDQEPNIEPLCQIASKKSILLISDTPGFAEQGIHLNMYLSKKQVRFKINKQRLLSTGLKINYLLLNYGEIVKQKGGGK